MRDDWLLLAGDDLADAADYLSRAADVLGAALGGDELGDAAEDLLDAAENISDSGQVNIALAGQKMVLFRALIKFIWQANHTRM